MYNIREKWKNNRPKNVVYIRYYVVAVYYVWLVIDDLKSHMNYFIFTHALYAIIYILILLK